MKTKTNLCYSPARLLTQRYKCFFIAATGGFSISVLLAMYEAVRLRGPAQHPLWVMILQAPGFLVGASIWGVHSGGNAFEVVMVFVNGIVYSSLLLVVWQLVKLAGKL